MLVDSSFQVENGIGGGACPAGGVPPFQPELIAGTLNNSAGAYSPMDIHITRNDGEQEITGFSSQLPPGLTANLSGIPFCSEAEIALARTQDRRAGGSRTRRVPRRAKSGIPSSAPASASCSPTPPARCTWRARSKARRSRSSSITSREGRPVRPRDRRRAPAADINPETAAVSIPAGAADQIPHIINGIVDPRPRHPRLHRPQQLHDQPHQLRPANLLRDGHRRRRGPHEPRGQQPVTTNDPFQPANCQSLKFKPKFKVSTSGKTSKADGASLTAKLTYPTAP